MSAGKKVSLLLLILAAQLLALGLLVFRYERVVRTGSLVRLACEAHDPMDVFRGRYLRVRVGETVTNLHSSVATVLATPTCTAQDERDICKRLFVRLAPSSKGAWHFAEVSLHPTEKGVWARPLSACVVRDREVDAALGVRVEFPSQLFLNERLAPEAERLLQTKTDGIVAVYRIKDGNVVITDVEIAGKSIFSYL